MAFVRRRAVKRRRPIFTRTRRSGYPRGIRINTGRSYSGRGAYYPTRRYGGKRRKTSRRTFRRTGRKRIVFSFGVPKSIGFRKPTSSMRDTYTSSIPVSGTQYKSLHYGPPPVETGWNPGSYATSSSLGGGQSWADYLGIDKNTFGMSVEDQIGGRMTEADQFAAEVVGAAEFGLGLAKPIAGGLYKGMGRAIRKNLLSDRSMPYRSPGTLGPRTPKHLIDRIESSAEKMYKSGYHKPKMDLNQAGTQMSPVYKDSKSIISRDPVTGIVGDASGYHAGTGSNVGSMNNPYVRAPSDRKTSQTKFYGFTGRYVF